MSTILTHLKYTPSHEWVECETDQIVRVGITDHAQALLGDIVFVELPTLNRTVTQKEEIAVLESVKAAADVYAPVSGEIIEVNTQLEQAPESINQDAYHHGWLVRIKLSDPSQLENLLSPAEYQQQMTVEVE